MSQNDDMDIKAVSRDLFAGLVRTVCMPGGDWMLAGDPQQHFKQPAAAVDAVDAAAAVVV